MWWFPLTLWYFLVYLNSFRHFCTYTFPYISPIYTIIMRNIRGSVETGEGHKSKNDLFSGFMTDYMSVYIYIQCCSVSKKMYTLDCKLQYGIRWWLGFVRVYMFVIIGLCHQHDMLNLRICFESRWEYIGSNIRASKSCCTSKIDTISSIMCRWAMNVLLKRKELCKAESQWGVEILV